MRCDLSEGIPLAILVLVVGCFSMVSATVEAEPVASNLPDDAYFKRILAAASFNRLGAELEWSKDLHPRLAEAEQVFNSHKRELLAPLVPYLRTFDGKEYPQLELRVIGGPVRRQEGKGLFEFWIDVFATLRPWGEGKAPGGMKPLLDETPRGWVEWDPKQNVVKRFRLSGLYRALPPEALDKALRIAQKQDNRYMRQALDDGHTGWEPAWFKTLGAPVELAKAPKADHSTPHLVVLSFIYPGGESIHAVPLHRVRVNLQTGKIVSVQTSLVDMGPRYKVRPSPPK